MLPYISVQIRALKATIMNTIRREILPIFSTY